MAKGRRSTGNRNENYDSYIYGNTVRVREPERRYEEQPRQREHTMAEIHTVRRNREKALQMDLPYVIILSVAIACVLVILVNYLHVQSSINAKIYHIEALETELETLRTENDALETRIHTNINLDRIYQIATEELGMVYANRNQVLLYDKTESEYVRQYENIPKY